MEHKSDWLDGWVGSRVLIECLTGPGRGAEDYKLVVEARGKAMVGDVQSLASVFKLVGYDGLGIVVKTPKHGEEEDGYFVPWGAVLSIQGLYWSLSEE